MLPWPISQPRPGSLEFWLLENYARRGCAGPRARAGGANKARPLLAWRGAGELGLMQQRRTAVLRRQWRNDGG